MTNKVKFTYGIKGKLISAVCMLLVAIIMVVSSTYAWFTLSTAPEVTGIQTAIGANGALEMALQPSDGSDPLSGMLPTNATQAQKNTYWGNLVDLSDTAYGMTKIVLNPSLLNINATMSPIGQKLVGAMLETPKYGADGRVSELVKNTVTGIYDTTKGTFISGTEVGVRAVGIASAMTERQIAYRNAVAAAVIAMNSAKNTATASLNNNGSALANIALKHATENDTQGYTQAEIAPLLQVVEDLQDALADVETAYKQYLLAYAASSDVTDEDVWQAVNAAINGGQTLSAIVTAAGSPGVLGTGIDKYETSVQNVTTAGATLETLTGETITWVELQPVLTLLADPDNMKINGIKASDLKTGDNMSDLVSSVMGNGVTVTIETDGGVYADIADQCGNYSTDVQISEVTYNGMVLRDVNARMATATTVDPVYLETLRTAVSGKAPEGVTDNTAQSITEYYGYIVDLAFRTNAAESNLLLQTAPKDRIYSDNANPETLGKGSTMTFQSTATGFGNEQVKNLMKCIRVVFFDTATGEIYATAMLDIDNATVGADGVTANLYLYATEEDEDGALTQTLITDEADAKITAMGQNATVKISALVYLDGETIENKDVAATATTSMTGTMNLQFSSSVELQPMEYAGLHDPSTNP